MYVGPLLKSKPLNDEVLQIYLKKVGHEIAYVGPFLKSNHWVIKCYKSVDERVGEKIWGGYFVVSFNESEK